MKPSFYQDGYAVYDVDPEILAWAEAAAKLAKDALSDPSLLEKWLVCQGTWFVGVDALPTGPQGQADGTPLQGQVIHDLQRYLPARMPLHKAQLSVVYPGYPKPREGESAGAFQYRQKRDAAHIDGLHATGPNRRRHLNERHAYLLGLPLNECSNDASPLVVWRGSHLIVQDWLKDCLGNVPQENWSEIDLTDGYLAIRRQIFDACERVELPVRPGQSIVMHRHALHGIAPWIDKDASKNDRRMMAYFRPEIAGDSLIWLGLK